MNNGTILRVSKSVVLALMLMLAGLGSVPAASRGGAHGGGGGGGGGRVYAGHSGGRASPYGRRFKNGIRGDYAYSGRWLWGGIGYGLFFAGLQLDYSTLRWNEAPNYYADPNYYQWNSVMAEYEAERPPLEPPATDLFAYPKHGQNTEQQAHDRSQCRAWAAERTGFDPNQDGDTGVGATASPTAQRHDYMRAQTACLEARDYCVN
jgi:hypothetical protein